MSCLEVFYVPVITSLKPVGFGLSLSRALLGVSSLSYDPCGVLYGLPFTHKAVNFEGQVVIAGTFRWPSPFCLRCRHERRDMPLSEHQRHALPAIWARPVYATIDK